MNIQDRETVEVVQGDEKVMETVSSFVFNATNRIDACIDKTRPVLSMDNEQIKELITSSRSKGVKLRCITEINRSNLYYCKQLLERVDELRHLDGIIGAFYVSDNECLVPSIIHKKEKPAPQIIYWNVKETVKQQQYVFEALWNKSISGQEKINEIEKGELPETTEVIRNRAEAQELAYKLVRSAETEILIIFSSSKAFIRQTNAGGDKLIVEVANSHNVSVIILTPMDEAAKKVAKEIEDQSNNIQIRSIGPSSSYTTTVVIVDRKFSLALELKDDSKNIPAEAIGNSTYSTSKSTVFSYIAMFESFMKLTQLYEESQSRLIDTTYELESMKKYLNEVLEEVDKFKKTK